MAERTFKWDASVLDPDKQAVTLGEEEIIFYEFPRTTTEQFIVEIIEKKISKEEKYTEEETKEDGSVVGVEKMRTVRLPFKEVFSQQSDLINKYLSKSTRNVKSPKYFAEAGFTANAYGRLVDLLFELNHVDEILSVGGNWLMMPSVYATRGVAPSADEKTS